MPDTIEELRRLGQSPWLDYIHRSFITSGALERYVRDGWVTGLTSNPTIFAQAISGSPDYDTAIEALAAHGTVEPYEAFIALAVDDIRSAADLFRPVYDETNGADGFASLEAPPGIEGDVVRLSAEVRRLFALLDRPNVMIKIPATEAGVQALPALLAEGINVNVTLMFSTTRYRQIAEAYLDGLERRLEAGQPLTRVASVASFFVSRVDAKVDARLPDDSPLRGRAAIANAQRAYEIFEQVFSGSRWQRLADAGALVQRPLWASTSTKDPAYPDVYYVEALIAPDTVDTMKESTLLAFADHGRAVRTIDAASIRQARDELEALRATGIDLERVAAELLDEGMATFARDFASLLDTVGAALRSKAAGASITAVRSAS
jgi:transaldolase